MGQGTRTDLPTEPSVRFQPRVPAELQRRLKAEARRRDVSVSYIVIRALERWLATEEGRSL